MPLPNQAGWIDFFPAKGGWKRFFLAEEAADPEIIEKVLKDDQQYE